MSSPTDVAFGDKGLYNLDTGIATLIGDVRVTQGKKQQLNGDYGEVNFNTGVSKLLSGPAAGRSGRRVRGLLEQTQETASTSATPNAAPVTPRSGAPK